MMYRRLLQQSKLSNDHLRRCLSSHTSSASLQIQVSQQQPRSGFYRFAPVSGPLFDKKPIVVNMPYNMSRIHFSSKTLVDLPVAVGGIVDVNLAQTGEGIAECELLSWFVCEGEDVDEFQRLCAVQSDKATIEITSRYKGKVSQILHVPGDIVKVGETLLKMYVEESKDPSLTCDDVENIKSLDLEISDSSSLQNRHNKGRVLATPAVRNLAKKYDINISDVQGTGRDGRVSEEDVLNYGVHKGIVREKSPPSVVSSIESFIGQEENCQYTSAREAWHHEDRILTLRGFHRAMFKSMTFAAKIPHFHYVEEIKCDAFVELKACFQKENSDPEVKYTFLPLLIKSLSMALSKYPLVNSCFNEQSTEVILRGSHNIGIAMATSNGLVVPNIKKVQSLSISEITRELSRLQCMALDNKLSPEDISGGTITLSNIGSIGGKFGSALLNVPEVAIIAVGRIQKVPQIADDESIYPASIMTVNIGADHRVLDGATVAKFCNEWKKFIEKPYLLLLHMR